jgi:hypothetical protein
MKGLIKKENKKIDMLLANKKRKGSSRRFSFILAKQFY